MIPSKLELSGPVAHFDRYEESIYRYALELNQWCVSECARQLGVSRATLYRVMKRYDLKRPLDVPVFHGAPPEFMPALAQVTTDPVIEHPPEVSVKTFREALGRTGCVFKVATDDSKGWSDVAVELWVFDGPGPTDEWYERLARAHLPNRLGSFKLHRIARPFPPASHPG